MREVSETGNDSIFANRIRDLVCQIIRLELMESAVAKSQPSKVGRAERRDDSDVESDENSTDLDDEEDDLDVSVSHIQCVTHPVCHTSNASHIQRVTHAVCHTCSASHVQCITHPVYHTSSVSHIQCVTHPVCDCVSHIQCVTHPVCHTSFSHFQLLMNNIFIF